MFNKKEMEEAGVGEEGGGMERNEGGKGKKETEKGRGRNYIISCRTG